MRRINKLLGVLLVGSMSVGVINLGIGGMTPASRIKALEERTRNARASISSEVSKDARALPALRFGYAWKTLETPGVSSRTVRTPERTLPSCDDYADACKRSATLQASTITSRSVESRTLERGPREVARLCAAIICVGPFTIPSVMFGPTPPVEEHSATTPRVTVASVCTEVSVACSGRTLVKRQRLDTPSLNSWKILGAGSISASTSRFSGSLYPSTHRIAWFDPVAFIAYVPGVGSIPVTLCPAGCAVPMPPGGTLHGSLTVAMTVGSNERTATIPIDLQW